MAWRSRRLPAPKITAGAVATGCGATLALVAYLLATRAQLLSIAVVLSSFYPAIPVLLGLTVLRERVNRAQVTGLLGAGAAIVLLILGRPGAGGPAAAGPRRAGARAARRPACRPARATRRRARCR